jgi:bla regulator protein blaR1
MTAPPFDAIVSWIGGRLLAGSVEAVILVSLVWFACRRGHLSAAMQATLWWLAALKVVIVLLPLPAVTLPLLPAPMPVQVVAADAVTDRPTGVSRDRQRGPGWEETDPQRRPGWNVLAVTVWLLVVIAHVLRLFGQHLHLRRVVRRSVPSGDDVGPLASAVGLRRIPAVHNSSDIDAPQVMGIVRPVILMPSAPLTDADRIMALSHELMHVRRGDLALGWVPAIAERLFFFHPLVRLAGREYHTAREAACDAAVLRALDVTTGDYARLLVRFGVASGQPAFVAGGASRSLSSLRRRLAMLQQSSSSGSRRMGWALSAVMLLAMIPIQLVAQAPSNRGVQSSNRGARLQADPAPPTLALKPLPAPVLESTLEAAATLVAQEPTELTERFLRERLAEVTQAARESQGNEQEKIRELERRLSLADGATEMANAVRENRRRMEIEAMLQVIEAHQGADWQQRTRGEFEKALEEARQKEIAVNQQFTEQQLDGLRRTIEQLADQLEEMRKMERQLREQLKK